MHKPTVGAPVPSASCPNANSKQDQNHTGTPNQKTAPAEVKLADLEAGFSGESTRKSPNDRVMRTIHNIGCVITRIVLLKRTTFAGRTKRA